MTDSKQRKIGSLLSYVSIVINTLIQLLYTPFMISKLGQSEYGLFSLVNSVIGYLTVLDLGFGNAIIVYTAKYRAQKKYNEEKKLHGMFRAIFRIIGVIAGFLGIILFLNVENFFGNTMTSIELKKTKIMMLILAFNLMINFQFSIYSSIISAYEKFTYQKIMSITSTLLKPLIMIPLLIIGYKSITMTIVTTIINISILISNYMFCRKKLNVVVKYQGFDKKIFKTIFGYSIWIFLSVIVDKVNWSVDQFILGAVAGTVAVSLYSTASLLNSLFINLSTAISGILLPKISKMVAKNASDEKITREFIKIGRLQYYVIFLMASGLVLFGKEFFIAWIGRKFITSYYIAIILTLPLCLPLIQNLGISIMQAKNMHKFRSVVLFIIAIVNVVISIPLAKNYGGVGSAIGTSISLLIGNVLILNIYYYKKVGINVIQFWKNILKMTLPFIIPIVTILIIMHFIVLHGYLYLIVFGAIYTGMYAAVCYFMVMNSYEKNMVEKVMKKLHIMR